MNLEKAKENKLEFKLKFILKNLNSVLEECREQNIGIAIGVEYPEKNTNDTIYCHKDNTTKFYVKEVYGK